MADKYSVFRVALQLMEYKIIRKYHIQSYTIYVYILNIMLYFLNVRIKILYI